MTRTIQEACDGKLGTRPLTDPQVRRWAARARPGRPMGWAPTLFRLGETSVEMWTGRSLSLRLLPLLGPRGTLPVVRDLRRTLLTKAGAQPQSVKNRATAFSSTSAFSATSTAGPATHHCAPGSPAER